MAVSHMKAVFPHDIYKVWEAVTDVEGYKWRSDISRTEILREGQFVEYTRKGYATTFTITVTEPYQRWEFDMENSHMQGHWTGIFTPRGKETEVDFTEAVSAKRIIMRPFVKSYLKRQQARFISDLQSFLNG